MTSQVEDTATKILRYVIRQVVDGKMPEVFDLLDSEQQTFIHELRGTSGSERDVCINAFIAVVSNE